MSMAPIQSTIFSFVFFILLCSMLDTTVCIESQLNLEAILAKKTVCSESKALRDNSVKLVHAYGPCSPTRQEPPNIVELLARDSLRLAYMYERVLGWQSSTTTNHSAGAVQLGQSTTMISVPARDILPLGGFGFMITIYVGNPKQEMYIYMDTGSDFCWIQCQPCIHCYPQHQPIFNPAKSTTRYMQCTDPVCDHQCLAIHNGNGDDHWRRHPRTVKGGTVNSGHGHDNNKCNRGRCTYRVSYMGEASYTSGFIVRDRVSMEGSFVVQDNFTFGCGNDNRGDLIGAAGLLGLGRTSLSFNKQMPHMGNIFSYCLPPTYKDTGHLKLGDGRYPKAVYTPLVLEPGYPQRFYVNMWGMSINGRLLPVQKRTFEEAKTVIDSGTMMSYIPHDAYTILRMAIRKSMTMFSLVSSPVHNVDTCYDFGNLTTVFSPVVTLHFTDAEINLGFTQTFVRVPWYKHIHCLAFMTKGITFPSVIGGVQQRGMEVIYDLGANMIGFSTITNCH